MKIEIPEQSLIDLVAKQLSTIFTLDMPTEGMLLSQCIKRSLTRCEVCFRQTKNKYYSKGGEVYFNPFHSGQYTIFLYFLSNEIYRRLGANNTLSDRVYYLNKTLNGLDLFYDIEMPEVFFLDHPVGSVLGRATYGQGFAFLQNCTVGNNRGIYPVFGQDVWMMSGAKVIGNCRVGNNVIISANCFVKDCDIPDNSLVFGSSPNIVIKNKVVEHFKQTPKEFRSES